MKIKFLNFLLLTSITLSCYPQTGGDNVYEFLNLTHSGLVASLGGTNVSLRNNDLNLVYHNPALLDQQMNENLALNYVNYFAGINYGQAMYSRSYNGIGNFAAGITYLNYGSFTEADETGTITGHFNAAEYALSFIYSRSIDSLFSAGIAFKPVLSQLERYNSTGFAFDIGAEWHNRSDLFSAGIAIKNIGCQITTYTGEYNEKLPFEIQAGISQKLAHAPFRFSLTARHLEKYDLTYQYEGATTANTIKSPDGFAENIMRHFILGVEFIPSKNFYLSAGYNYQRRREMEVESRTSTTGFSWGFGINTTLLNIEFGRATYHLAGSTNSFSLILKTDHIFKKSRK